MRSNKDELNNQKVLTKKGEYSPKPFLFLALCSISLVLYASLLLLIYYLIFPRITDMGQTTFYIISALLFMMFAIPAGGFLLILLTVMTGADLLYPHRKRAITVSVLFPFAIWFGKLLRIDRERILGSFIAVNNRMVIAQEKRLSGKRLLILLPHCVQIDKCNRKITNNLDNCIKCGQCVIGSVKETGIKYNAQIDVVNGGTLARKRIVDFRPTGIVAVACERDLTTGVVDAYPIPVLCVINNRPYGPCHNTTVNMDMLDKAVGFYSGK